MLFKHYFIKNAPGRSRTSNLRLRRPSLYPLSHRRITLFLKDAPFLNWRRGRDSNPGTLAGHTLSKRALSTTQPPLQKLFVILKYLAEAGGFEPPRTLRLFRFSKPVHSTNYATPPAEERGFEPLRHLTAPNCFQDSRFQPLSHSSKNLPQKKLLKNNIKYIFGRQE